MPRKKSALRLIREARFYPQGIEDRREVMRQTDVLSESELFPSLESGVDAVTEAVLVIIPGTVGSTRMSTVAVAPFPIPPRLHVTVPPDSPHDPWLGVAETKVTVDGS